MKNGIILPCLILLVNSEEIMKTTINKKVYDTEKAKEIGKQTVGYFGDTFGFEEVLYQKSTKEFFLFATGGSDSQYPEACILPMTNEASDEWLKRVCGADYAAQVMATAKTKKATAKKTGTTKTKVATEAKASTAKATATAKASKKTATTKAPAKKSAKSSTRKTSKANTTK